MPTRGQRRSGAPLDEGKGAKHESGSCRRPAPRDKSQRPSQLHHRHVGLPSSAALTSLRTPGERERRPSRRAPGGGAGTFLRPGDGRQNLRWQQLDRFSRNPKWIGQTAVGGSVRRRRRRVSHAPAPEHASSGSSSPGNSTGQRFEQGSRSGQLPGLGGRCSPGAFHQPTPGAFSPPRRGQSWAPLADGNRAWTRSLALRGHHRPAKRTSNRPAPGPICNPSRHLANVAPS